MKNIKISFLIPLMLLFVACGGGGGNTSNGDNNMIVGKKYMMSKGRTIVKKTDPTVVLIETNIETGKTIATLQSGSAAIE